MSKGLSGCQGHPMSVIRLGRGRNEGCASKTEWLYLKKNNPERYKELRKRFCRVAYISENNRIERGGRSARKVDTKHETIATKSQMANKAELYHVYDKDMDQNFVYYISLTHNEKIKGLYTTRISPECELAKKLVKNVKCDGY